MFSLHFDGHFPEEPGLAGTRMSLFWIFFGAKDDGGGGDNWNYKTCIAPIRSSPSTNQHALPATPKKQCHSHSTEGK